MAKQKCPSCHAQYDDSTHEVQDGGDVAAAVNGLRSTVETLSRDVRELKQGRPPEPPAPPEPVPDAPPEPVPNNSPAIRSGLVVHA